MKDFWKKYKLWLSIAIYLSAVAVLFLFVVMPLLGAIQKKSDEIQKIKIDTQISQGRIDKLPEMRELHAILDQEKNSLNVILDQNNSVDFIKKLELLAQETGNKISLKIDDNSTVAKSSKDSKDKKTVEGVASSLPSDNYLSMEITLEGKYENFASFLHKIENLDYYVNVLSLSLIKETVEQESSYNEAGLKKETDADQKSILVSKLNIIVYRK